MQAGKSKADRKASQAERAALRPGINAERFFARRNARDAKRIVIARIEAGRAEYACPSHIKAVKAQYDEQCAEHRIWMQNLRIDQKADHIEFLARREKSCQQVSE